MAQGTGKPATFKDSINCDIQRLIGDVDTIRTALGDLIHNGRKASWDELNYFRMDSVERFNASLNTYINRWWAEAKAKEPIRIEIKPLKMPKATKKRKKK